MSEVDEVQPNGKVFKKAIFGQYQWMTFQEVGDRVESLAKGLTELGIRKVGIYMDTRADWMIAVQACFRHNIQVTTVYATLGQDAVSSALIESETEYLITSGQLLDKNIPAVLKKAHLKKVIWAPFERSTQNIKLSPSDYPECKFYTLADVQELGDKSLLKAPEAPSADTIAIIMYTSGTSGKPKGVMISQANMVAACSGIGQRLQTGIPFSPSGTYEYYYFLTMLTSLF